MQCIHNEIFIFHPQPHTRTQDVDYDITIRKTMDQFSGATTRCNLSQSLLFQGNENAE